MFALFGQCHSDKSRCTDQANLVPTSFSLFDVECILFYDFAVSTMFDKELIAHLGSHIMDYIKVVI